MIELAKTNSGSTVSVYIPKDAGDANGKVTPSGDFATKDYVDTEVSGALAVAENYTDEAMAKVYTKEEVDALVANGVNVYKVDNGDILSSEDYEKLFDAKSIVLLKQNTDEYVMVYRKSDELWALVDFSTDGNNSFLSLKLAKGTLQSDGTYLIGIREVRRNVDAYTKAKTDELVADAKECIFITRAQVLTDEELEKINSGKYLICLKNDDGDVIPLSQRSDGNMYGSYYSYHNYTWGLQQLITTTYRVCIEDNTVHLSNGDADIRFYNVKDSSKVLTASYTTDYINNNYGRKAVATVEEDGLILDTNGTYTYSGDTFSAITPDIAYTAHKFALEIDNFEPKLTLSNGSDACYNMHMVNYYINADRSKEWTTELVMIFEGYYKGKHINATLTIPKVWGDVDGWEVVYTIEGGVEPLYFTALEDSTISLTQVGTPETYTTYDLSTSTDGVNWDAYTLGDTIDLASGDTLYWKGNNRSMAEGDKIYKHFVMTGKVEASGSVYSLLGTDTLSRYAFGGLFYGCETLVSAPELPATTLADYCYAYMFYGCTSLTTAPALPATELTYGCYQYMFKGCTSLATAPELPATELKQQCYRFMFDNCTSLTTAPELPATTLVNDCYYNMFYGCTNLTTAPELPATTLAEYCYYGMFKYCKSLTTAPTLPATTLTKLCYCGMLLGCTNLNYIKCLTTDISATNCTLDWVKNVASTGTFVKANGMEDWATGVNGIPEGWTVQDAE